jgi:hypothetical protein
MGVVAKTIFLPPLPLLDCTLLNAQSQAFNPKKNGDFFLSQSIKNPIVTAQKNNSQAEPGKNLKKMN